MKRIAAFGVGSMLLVFVLTVAGVQPAEAQFSGMLHKLENKAAQKADQKAEQKMGLDSTQNQQNSTQSQQSGSAHTMLKINSGDDFAPAPVVLYQDNYTSAPIGAMPSGWKTNGSGQLVSIQGIAGKWLQLGSGGVFKLTLDKSLPQRFTIQFDLIPAAYQTGDIDGFAFGFDPDNSLRSEQHLNRVYLATAPGYYNVSSNATGYSNEVSFDFSGYANQIMHFAITANDGQMTVYMNHNKIADARLFEDNPSRYFYIVEPDATRHGAHILISNFRVATYQQ